MGLRCDQALAIGGSFTHRWWPMMAARDLLGEVEWMVCAAGVMDRRGQIAAQLADQLLDFGSTWWEHDPRSSRARALGRVPPFSNLSSACRSSCGNLGVEQRSLGLRCSTTMASNEIATPVGHGHLRIVVSTCLATSVQLCGDHTPHVPRANCNGESL